jgi:hypothetical protein
MRALADAQKSREMRGMILLSLIGSVLGGWPGAVMAQTSAAPVALVEEVSGNPPGIQFMDYVVPGQVIRLAPGDAIVLGYMTSCWRESIKGGTITAGTEQSEVQNGKVERAKVNCNGGKMQLTESQASKSAALVFRDRPRPAQPQPQVTLYGLSPIIEIKPGTLIIERLDKTGERYELVVENQRLVHGSFYDLANEKGALTAGGIYRASTGTREVIFKIDASARPGPAPIVSRLLRFPPAS